MNRRRFLQAGTAAAAGAGLTLSGARGLAAMAADMAPKRVGLIGTGWYGKADLLRLIQVAPVEVVSLCDVDKAMLAEAGEIVASRQSSGKVPRQFHDYRDMLKEKDLDLVLIATPDHWHALPMIAACEAGVDIYVQKPISVDVAEGRAMLEAARTHGRVVQVGTQRRSTPHLIEAMEKVVKPGLLGKVAHAECYCYYHMRAGGHPEPQRPPDNLDFDFWTGPAPLRPYVPIMHPRGWRAFMEYGNGIVGDMCIHMLDMVRWMLDLGWPRRVSSTGGIFVDKDSIADISDTQTATFDFGDMTVVWQHRTWGEPVDRDYPWGATIYGDKGTLKLSVQRWDFAPTGGGAKPMHGEVVMELDKYPEDRTEKDLERHVAPAIRGHMLDFLAAVESRGKPVADIEQGHISTASCILANLSMELGRALTWDAEAGKVVGDDEANARLARPYRGPWVHPKAGA
jgi:predicted dehydrogenase